MAAVRFHKGIGWIGVERVVTRRAVQLGGVSTVAGIRGNVLEGVHAEVQARAGYRREIGREREQVVAVRVVQGGDVAAAAAVNLDGFDIVHADRVVAAGQDSMAIPQLDRVVHRRSGEDHRVVAAAAGKRNGAHVGADADNLAVDLYQPGTRRRTADELEQIVARGAHQVDALQRRRFGCLFARRVDQTREDRRDVALGGGLLISGIAASLVNDRNRCFQCRILSRPGHHEVAIALRVAAAARGNGRLVLIAVGPAVHAELADRIRTDVYGIDVIRAVTVVHPGIDAVVVDELVMRIVLIERRPCDDENAVVVHADVRILLEVLRRLVDAELAALRGAAAVVPLGIDSPSAAVLAIALPGNHKVAGVVHGNGRILLVVTLLRVHAELAAKAVRRRAVSLGINAPRIRVLVVAGPGNHEVARGIHGHVGRRLGVRRICVHQELVRQRLARPSVFASHDVIAAGVPLETRPGNHKVAVVLVNGNRRLVLVVLGVLVNQELSAHGLGFVVEPLGEDTRA